MESIVLGWDDDVGFDVVGAARARRAMPVMRKPAPRWAKGATQQGVSLPEEEMDICPFVAISIAAGSLTGTLISSPQRPFRGERLIMTAISNALDAAANVVIDPAIFVGAVQVGAVQGSTPIATFAATAFGVRLTCPTAGQGTDIRIPVRLLAAAANATVVTAVLIGRAVR